MSEKARKAALETYYQTLPEKPALGEATEGYKLKDELAYQISRLPLGTSRPLKVVCVGAGFSGLALAHEVETGQLENVHLTVYEKNAAVGGTWYENRYPGYVQCYLLYIIHKYFHLLTYKINKLRVSFDNHLSSCFFHPILTLLTK